ncbi:MAG: hypothetical protein OSB46_17055, partial [Alphaproteobacteria bacterium]|nr:hypothetical protein [Alphaproteobacteria bacterium]
ERYTPTASRLAGDLSSPPSTPLPGFQELLSQEHHRRSCPCDLSDKSTPKAIITANPAPAKRLEIFMVTCLTS